MPGPSVAMIRAAMVWLAIGSTIGGLMLAHKGVPFAPELWALRDAHIHAMLVGWMLQLAIGVAYWILPRLDARGDRGDARPVWLCWAALNIGAAIELLGSLTPSRWADALAGGLYLVAATAFVLHAWPRVLPFRTLPRE